MTTVYFIRHGQSVGNLQRRFLGHTDLDLTELGYRQAEKCAELFKNIQVDAVYSSNLIRAFNTVSPIACSKGINVIPCPELREISSGEWENKEFDRLCAEFADDYGVWLNDIGHAVCTGGESVAALQRRVALKVGQIVGDNPGKTLVVGTHATPIRALTCLWRGAPIDRMKDFAWVPNASVTRIDYENGLPTVVTYGDIAHLDGLSSGFKGAKV